MKKTLIALLTLSSMAMGVDLQKITDMSAFIGSGTMGKNVTNISSDYEAGNTVLTFGAGNGGWTGITNQDLLSTIQAKEGYLTIVAWVKPEAATEVSVFGYGAQETGVKVGFKNSGIQITTKGKTDINSGSSSITLDDSWQMVTWSYNLDDTGSGARMLYGANGADYWTRDKQSMNYNAPAAADWTFGIGTGNSTSARDVYVGELANLTFYHSTALADASSVAALKSSAPQLKQVPEPATGTLSLLALAGLCARRRKH